MKNEGDLNRRNFFSYMPRLFRILYDKAKDSAQYGFGGGKEDLESTLSKKTSQIRSLSESLSQRESQYKTVQKENQQLLNQLELQLLEANKRESELTSLEKQVELSHGLVAWRNLEAKRLMREKNEEAENAKRERFVWLSYFRNLAAIYLKDEPYIFVGSFGRIEQVSKSAAVLLKYEGNVMGRKYREFIEKEKKDIKARIKKEFFSDRDETSEEGREAYFERIYLKFPGRKPIKVNISVLPCPGPINSGIGNIGYFVLLKRSKMKIFEKDRMTMAVARQKINELTGLLDILDKKIKTGNLQDLQPDHA